MKKVYEYDFSFQATEGIEDAIKELNNTKQYLNESINNTIKNTGDVDLLLCRDKFQIEFMLDYETVLENYQSFDHVFDYFIDANEGHDYALTAYKELKENILKQVEKLDNEIKKLELS